MASLFNLSHCTGEHQAAHHGLDLRGGDYDGLEHFVREGPVIHSSPNGVCEAFRFRLGNSVVGDFDFFEYQS